MALHLYLLTHWKWKKPFYILRNFIARKIRQINIEALHNKIMRVGSVTFCGPFIQKILQIHKHHRILCAAFGLVKFGKNLIFKTNFVSLLNERVAKGNASDPRDFIIQGLNVYLSYFPRIKISQNEKVFLLLRKSM